MQPNDDQPNVVANFWCEQEEAGEGEQELKEQWEQEGQRKLCHAPIKLGLGKIYLSLQIL